MRAPRARNRQCRQLYFETGFSLMRLPMSSIPFGCHSVDEGFRHDVYARHSFVESRPQFANHHVARVFHFRFSAFWKHHHSLAASSSSAKISWIHGIVLDCSFYTPTFHSIPINFYFWAAALSAFAPWKGRNSDGEIVLSSRPKARLGVTQAMLPLISVFLRGPSVCKDSFWSFVLS